MGISEKVAVLIDTEVEKRVHEELCKVVEKVSNLYHVPIKVVRKDLMTQDTFCMGVKRNGKLCTNKAVSGGYCMFHVTNEPHKQILCGTQSTGVRHNHPFPSPPQKDCPACKIAEEKSNVNEFRDLSTIM